MLAIADHPWPAAHTQAALATLKRAGDIRTKRWSTSLYNNYGWRLHDDERTDEALEPFTLAPTSAVTDQQHYWARWLSRAA